MLTLELKSQAAEDLRYLLNRGYTRESTVRFVGDRFALGKPERIALYRCVHPSGEARRRSSKLLMPEHLRGRRLALDGFNIMWTIYWAINGHPLLLCDDGVVRDITVARGRPSVEKAGAVAGPLISAISALSPSSVAMVFDKQISNSGAVSAYLNERLLSSGIDSRSSTSRTADLEISRTEGVACSSDSIVIDKAREAFDLAGYAVVRILGMLPTKI